MTCTTASQMFWLYFCNLYRLNNLNMDPSNSNGIPITKQKHQWSLSQYCAVHRSETNWCHSPNSGSYWNCIWLVMTEFANENMNILLYCVPKLFVWDGRQFQLWYLRVWAAAAALIAVCVPVWKRILQSFIWSDETESIFAAYAWVGTWNLTPRVYRGDRRQPFCK